jgi:DNA-binding MarR family transcriptional regulator
MSSSIHEVNMPSQVATPPRKALLHRLAGLQPAMRARFRATIPESACPGLSADLEQVTAAQVEALMLLHESGRALSMHELAEALSASPSSATQMVDRLVRMGLVERLREEEDRRLVRIQLSVPARERFEEMLSARLGLLASATAPLCDAELATLVELLEKVAASATVGGMAGSG